MSHAEASSTRSSRPRSRPAMIRGKQPTVPQLARLGIEARDFAYESTLPPVKTIYRQARQIQPQVARQVYREDTEPLDDKTQSQSAGPALKRTDTEPVLEKEQGPSLARQMGGFFEVNGGTDQIINVKSQPFHLHPQPRYTQEIDPLVASQDMKVLVPTPTVSPNGSLQLKEAPTKSDISHLRPSLSGLSSPLTILTPSPPNRQGSGVFLDRSSSLVSLHKPTPKRRKITTPGPA